MAQREFRQIYPQPGWVEHDPTRDLEQPARDRARGARARPGCGAADIAAHRHHQPARDDAASGTARTGEPIGNAIVWQDRRTAPACAALRARGLEPLFREQHRPRPRRLLLGHQARLAARPRPGARAAAERGELAFGTVDSWLMWQLTGGATRRRARRGPRHRRQQRLAHAAVRRARAARGATSCCGARRAARACCPRCIRRATSSATPTADLLGAPIAIGGVAGDQQSALFGQACFAPGRAKNTYGTGCFMLMNTGARFETSANGLITTSAAQAGARPQFALEGSVFIGGAVVQWLRDGLQAITGERRGAGAGRERARQRRRDVRAGLHRPRRALLEADARGTIVGLTRGTTIAHIARAALESIAFQSAALLEAMSTRRGRRRRRAGRRAARRRRRLRSTTC